MKNLIDYAYNDNGTEFRDALYSAIHDKVAAHIDAKKQEIAAGLMGQQSEEVELEEDAGAYETWDPKHPHFVKNYKKYQSDNDNQGSIKDFIEKEKARPKRLPEEFESLDEMENYEAVTAARDAHVKSFMDKTGLPEAHAKQYHAAVVKYPNNAMAGAEQAANRIAGPQVKVKFHQSPKTYQDKHIAHVKTMKGIMNP